MISCKTFKKALSLSLIIILGSMNAGAKETYASQTLLTLDMCNATVKEVFTAIESQSDFVFLYYDDEVDPGRKVSINVVKKLVNVVLDQMFESTDIVYSINDRQIVIAKKGQSRQQPAAAQSKDGLRELKGKVIDRSTGDPLIGATIQVQGASTIVAITDVDGNFTMRIPERGTNLLINYIGFKERIFRVTTEGLISIELTPDNETLSEVVVVGAGTQKRVSVTGAILGIDGEQLLTPSSSLSSVFAGKLAGVISHTSSGEPGAASEFYIRGIGTFGGRVTPLIIADGVEITTEELNAIPSENILSFSVLKDASATAIYGARGAAGVLILTTKSGVENSPTVVKVTIENTVQKPMNLVEFVDGATWMEAYNEAQISRNPGTTPRFSEDDIAYTRSGKYPYRYPDVDWVNMLFKDYTMNQRANINVSGGGSKATYYMSLQYNHDSGSYNAAKKYSFQNNTDRNTFVFQNNVGYKLTKSTKVSLRINATFMNEALCSISAATLLNEAYQANPIEFPACYPDQEGMEHFMFGSRILKGSTIVRNPYTDLANNWREHNNSRINVSLDFDQGLEFITKGLKLSGLVNIKNYAQTEYTRRIEPYYYHMDESTWDINNPDVYELYRVHTSGQDFINESGVSRQNNRTIYLDARLNYNRTFGLHSFSGLLMYMQREFREAVQPNRMQSFSGRATYDYSHRYLLEVNFGYNGTERLEKGNRFEFFPAISAGWVISEEKFWEPFKNISNYFKVRTSYGIVGSDETGKSAGAPHYIYLDNITMGAGATYQTGSSSIIARGGPKFKQFGILGASWERVKKFDVGVDFKLFDQFNITADYFHDKRDRIFMKRASFPKILGYGDASPWANVGKTDNKGFELSVNWKKEIASDLRLDARFNLTYNNAKYVYKDEPEYDYVWQMDKGKPIQHLTGYVCDGLFENQEEIDAAPSQPYGKESLMVGDLKYRDINGDGSINDEDKVMVSSYGSTPRMQYGVGLDITYKKLDVGIFFNGSSKRAIMVHGLMPFCSNTSHTDLNLMKFIWDDHYSINDPDNFDVKYPRMGVTTTQVQHTMLPSSFWVRDAGFLRFKTFEVGYRIPYARIYLIANNLYVWSKFKAWDPELSWNAYPLQLAVSLGVQFTF